MVSIIVLSASFAIASIALFRNNKKRPDERGLIGLNSAGLALIAILTLGFLMSLKKEISSMRNAQQLEVGEKERTEMLTKIDVKITDLAQRVNDQQLKDELNDISRRVSQVASIHVNSNFSWSIFRGSNFERGVFARANFAGANFYYASLPDTSFEHADLERSDLDGASFQNATLRETNFRHANFGGADFSAASFRDANLRETYFGHANLGNNIVDSPSYPC